MKKDTLLKGTIILAVAALIARGLGIFQRVPLDYVLGDAGKVYFGNANNVYLLLLVVATAGIPSAVSKMVSERYAIGRVKEAKQVYRAAILFGAVAGVVITLGMLGLAPLIAGPILGHPGAASAMRAIAPSLLLFPIIAMMRGYFQGRQLMSAGGMSQIVEQILRVSAAVAIAFAIYAMNPANSEGVAAGASFGSVFGSIGAFLVMLYYGNKLKANDRAETEEKKDDSRTLRFKEIYRELFALSIPIVLTSITYQLVFTLDGIMAVSLTRGHFDPELIVHWSGILTVNAQSIAGIPVILAIALSQSIIPVISSAYAKGDHDSVGRQASLAVRLALYTGMPVVLLLGVGAYSVNGLLFKEADGSLIVAMLTFGTLFQIGMMVTNSISLGLGQPKKATMHALTGILIKIVLSFALAPWLGIYGIILSTAVCFAWTLFFNVLSLRKRTSFNVIGKGWPGYLATVAISIAVIALAQKIVLAIGGGLPDKAAFFLSCAVMGAAVVAIYPVLLALFRVITPEEAEMYPRKVQRLLRPVLKLASKINVTQRG